VTQLLRNAPGTRVVLRCLAFYLILVLVGVIVWDRLPTGPSMVPTSLEALFGRGDAIDPRTSVPPDEVSLALAVAVAMSAAALLSLPVAWIYQLTRAKRGYQQSVVQLLIVLPTVVAGIVLLVKYSLALAFSLAGIVAAVRFRNSLDDSKDAVYVFLATGVGLASAVNLPVAMVLSATYNFVALVLWYTDFGASPVELDGRMAERRLAKARQLARTGTFVARMDDEVLRNMTAEQLEGLAERAWRRARGTESGAESGATPEERTLRLVTGDPTTLRRVVEPRLAEFTKTWRFHGMETLEEGARLEYRVQLRKKSTPEELLALVRAVGAAQLSDATLD